MRVGGALTFCAGDAASTLSLGRPPHQRCQAVGRSSCFQRAVSEAMNEIFAEHPTFTPDEVRAEIVRRGLEAPEKNPRIDRLIQQRRSDVRRRLSKAKATPQTKPRLPLE